MNDQATNSLTGQCHFGIEHEVAFWNLQTHQFADFTNTTFDQFDRLIAQLPEYATDYPQLRIGDMNIKRKRWYIEGYERFSEAGELLDCAPKGIEIRTTIQPTIASTIQELRESFSQLCEVAAPANLLPVLISFNPIQTDFLPQPPLNHYESARREASPEKRTAHIPMLTYGPDLNFSMAGLSPEALIRVGKKLTYYSPAIVPFSFSSPFYGRQLWSGLSVRTHLRTGRRPAAMVFLERPEDLLESTPSLTKIARLPAEIGRIEFKACDSCGDFALYGSLLALIKGLVLDQTLPGLALVPDALAHQRSALYGFQDEQLREQATLLLRVAAQALTDPAERSLLQPLWQMVQTGMTPAQALRDRWQPGTDLAKLLSTGYAPETMVQSVGR
ncbi:MAG: glutamate--cysteine ligase [Leptolyngbya sp. SIOISBB]|nr:glutamate--cysteine ligase [Leptolyngbya sp. SIOISBB]